MIGMTCLAIWLMEASHWLNQQWLSTFGVLQLFNTAPHIVVTYSHEIISMRFYNYNLVTVMNSNVNVWHAIYMITDSKNGYNTQVENCSVRSMHLKCFHLSITMLLDKMQKYIGNRL